MLLNLNNKKNTRIHKSFGKLSVILIVMFIASFINIPFVKKNDFEAQAQTIVDNKINSMKREINRSIVKNRLFNRSLKLKVKINKELYLYRRLYIELNNVHKKTEITNYRTKKYSNLNH